MKLTRYLWSILQCLQMVARDEIAFVMTIYKNSLISIHKQASKFFLKL